MYACNKFVNSIWGKAPRRTLSNNVSKKLRNFSAIGPKTVAVSCPALPKKPDFHRPRILLRCLWRKQAKHRPNSGITTFKTEN
jgi:hypothetical protein